MKSKNNGNGVGLGTAPVFFTAISTILGAILYLRFGMAVGSIGFLGVILVVLLGHAVTIPTSFAISEIATNRKVKGGGEYYIISRSFGLNIGATIGIALYFSQTISIAFYVIAFTEAFEPVFNWLLRDYGISLPRQAISLPAMGLLTVLILSKGMNLGVKFLYIVVGILIVSLIAFFAGSAIDGMEASTMPKFTFRNSSDFFIVFAIIFPAFTGMTAGVGLSGDLKNPSRSIPLGTISATIIGLIIYFFIAWKLDVSASPEDLSNNQLIMSEIALFGFLLIPLGLGASTISSALGSVMVAPRTLQALAHDRAFPGKPINYFLAKGKSTNKEPFNASLVSCIIAFVFVAVGNVDVVARIISMFFMVSYGTLCLISFLYHFSADPSYRPIFRSRWYISLAGFIICLWLMFKMDTIYALLAISVMVLLYNLISYYNKGRGGLQFIFKGALFQLSRSLQVYLQKSKRIRQREAWRPSVVAVSKDSLDREEPFQLLNWIAYRYGFGTYIHLIEDYFSKNKQEEATEILKTLVEKQQDKNSNVYIDTLISPSYTSAIAQIIQLPGISGMENNMMLFEFEREDLHGLDQILDNFKLVRAGNNDVGIYGISKRKVDFRNGIHVWLKSADFMNANLMIMLSYIISAHPDWRKSAIKIFDITKQTEIDETRENLVKLVKDGRIPIYEKNIEIIPRKDSVSSKSIIIEKSADAGLTIIGFHSDRVKHEGEEVFKGYDNVGNILFVNASDTKLIN